MALSWQPLPATQDEQLDAFMAMLEDDTEDAPWMVMGDLQFWSASGFAHSLRVYARTHDLPWYVASMLPIRYTWRTSRRKKQLAPDCFVAFAPDRPRSSYNMEAEGGFPPFVVEVVSPSSAGRDKEDKVLAYGALGVQEYVLFTPRGHGESRLAGYRRDATGVLGPWPLETGGSLWSDVLHLRLVMRDDLLTAETAMGERLLLPEEESRARLEAEQTRRQVEEEVHRLREELDRLKGERR